MPKSTLKQATFFKNRKGGIEKSSKKPLLLVSLLAASVVALASIWPSQPENRQTVTELTLDKQPTKTPPAKPATSIAAATQDSDTASDIERAAETVPPEPTVVAAPPPAEPRWQTLEIRSGDNLSTLFGKMGLGSRVVYELSNTPKFGQTLTSIRPGQSFAFQVDDSNTLIKFRYTQDKLNSILFEKTESGYEAKKVTLEPEVRVAYAEATIQNSLFLASQNVGLPDKMTMELASIFGWDIDFALDIRTGDRFRLIYEEKYLDDEKLSNGNILAATFTNRGKTYTAVRYTESSGESGYFSPDGRSMRKAFLRTPVEFTRISSRFNPNRLHPIFKTKRPHRAVDYAAPTGTPIKAAGSGKVQFAGWQKGYGNVVFIEHPNNIVTVYAHQSRLHKKLKKGIRVKQGEVIGYVGSTGWATGPHLHYEFRVNGVHRNPVTVKLPDASPIAPAEREAFMLHTSTTLATLEKHSGTMLARSRE